MKYFNINFKQNVRQEHRDLLIMIIWNGTNVTADIKILVNIYSILQDFLRCQDFHNQTIIACVFLCLDMNFYVV